MAVVGASASLSAQTITNVAQARWTVSGMVVETQSNRVEVTIASPAASLDTFRLAADSTLRVSLAEGNCAWPGGTAGTVGIAPATQFRPGEPIIFVITATSANRDNAAIERLTIAASTGAGTRTETVAVETASDSGRFAGWIGTRRSGDAGAAGDPACALGVVPGETVTIALDDSDTGSLAVSRDTIILADPFGMVFDSETGAPVSGARVTLRDDATGAPAQVFAEDGVTGWPSSMISGEAVSDAAGQTYPMAPGRYWFPRVSPGRYRIVIEPPDRYAAPSGVSAQRLAQLPRPDGGSFAISAASFGGAFDVSGPAPVEVDIPVDRTATAPELAFTVSRPRAQPGDVLIYSLVVGNPQAEERRALAMTIAFPEALRIRPESLRIDGQAPQEDTAAFDASGQTLTIQIDRLAGQARATITYAATIRADAPPRQLVSSATLRDTLGRSVRAEAVVAVEREAIAGRMTIIGRVLASGCDTGEDGAGLGGVRVLLEDGSFAVTDADGRYHFEGVVPGTHVVQIARATLPPGAKLADCVRSARSAGDAGSRFVIGQGGSLARADFHVVSSVGDAGLPRIAFDDNLAPGEDVTAPTGRTALPAPALTKETDWLALGDGPDGWLAPAPDHNPRAPAVRVAFRHRSGQTIRLYVDGKPVDPVAFDVTLTAANGAYAVSLWRGIPLQDERTVLAAEIINSLGGVNARLEREVWFTSEPARAELVADQSLLIADGVTRPVLVVRITDRNGRPVREGLSGTFTLGAPFESAAQIEQQQLRQLSTIGEASARWVTEGEDGLARIELAPTMVSGQLRIAFDFGSENIRRRQEIEAWVVPGDVEWTIVGLGEATLGARSVADNMERGGDFDSDLGRNARVALYAKGRVLGKYLLTLAYDSAKQRDDQPVLGAIDPAAYYTVFGDTSQRRFDAATREKLYVRIESASFLALYGDFQTGFDQTTLGRYQRTATGVRAAAQLGDVRAEAFGARIGTTFRRDEFQGNGLAGPYTLGTRDILFNSERVTIEVRDRFRSEVVVASRSLTRFIDYNIDLLSGTITFSEPILSRDADLNPQIVIIEYETGAPGGGAINAGVRAEWAADDGAVRIGASAISDANAGERTHLAVADARVRLGTASELRAEAAISAADGETANAWLVEMQHQTGKLDVVAYARQIEAGYGVGQQSLAETGRRKLGLDARYLFDDSLSGTASLLQDESLVDAAQRRGAQVELAWRSPDTDARLGLARFEDRLANGARGVSTVLRTAASQRLFDNRLEIGADSSFALGKATSLDLPPRHRLDLRYALSSDVRLTGSYEIADSAAIKARTLRAGVELSPWTGGRIVSSLGQNTGGDGPRIPFAGVSLAQSVTVSSSLNLGATLEANRLLGPAPGREDVINPAQPLANGGPLGIDRTLFEDFTAVTLTGAWRSGRWTANLRAEYRDGQFANRMGAALGVIRQLGEGRALGGSLLWTRSTAPGGAMSEIIDAGITLAHRPDGSDFAMLGRIAYRSDAVSGGVAGQFGPVGRTALDVTGDAVSRRLVGSLSANWSPRGGGGAGQIGEIGLFLGSRYSFDSLEGLDLAGLTALAGLDVRIGLSERFDIGGSATLRGNVTDGTFSYAIGPQASMTVAEGTLLSLGYNIAGFRDPDFSLERALDKGLFAAIRFKFDADMLGIAGNASQTTGRRETQR